MTGRFWRPGWRLLGWSGRQLFVRPVSLILNREFSRLLQSRVEANDGSQSMQLQEPFEPGWYMLEWRAVGKVGYLSLALAFESGADTVTGAMLPFRVGRLAKRIIWLPKPVSRVRMQIEGEHAELVLVRHFRLIRLRPAFAIDRMLRRVDLSAEAVTALAQAEGVSMETLLFEGYNRSFLHQGEGYYQHWMERVEAPMMAAALSGLPAVEAEPDIAGTRMDYWHLAPGYQGRLRAQVLLQQVLDRNPQVMLAYADEDVMDAFGRRTEPYFKPEWNPDLFLSRDYITACCIYRRTWYEQHRALFDALGERMALNALLPGLRVEAVQRLPLILAHRLADASAVVDEGPQPHAIRHRPSVPAHRLESAGEGGDCLVDRRAAVLGPVLPAGVKIMPGLLPDSLRVCFPVPDPAPLVSLLVPTRDGLAVLRPCVESILAHTTYPNYEILILDNQSGEPETLDWFRHIAADARVRIIRYDHPFNYSAINNYGVQQAHGSLIGLINNDVEVIRPDWLTEMASHALRPDIGCVGAKLYYSNGRIQHGGVILGLGHVAGHAHRFLARDADGYQGRLKLVQNYSAVTAACLLVRREIYEQVGGLEETHLVVAYNDVDFCLRVRAVGYRNLWTPYAELYHHESISRGEDDTPVKKARFEREVAYMRRTWGDELDHDPCYHPALTRRGEDFSIHEFL